MAAAKAVAAWVEGKEKSSGHKNCVGVGFPDPILKKGRERRKMFLRIISDKKAVNKNENENKKINFLSRLLTPGFFLSSKITTIKITNIQTKIELPLREKKEKK